MAISKKLRPKDKRPLPVRRQVAPRIEVAKVAMIPRNLHRVNLAGGVISRR